MSELNAMGCEEFADVAAELALGVLTGRERAEALAHLDQCDACRENVRQLTQTGEQLLELLPAAEPPLGFETRVMERIGLAVPEPPRRKSRPRFTRRMLMAAAVVAAIVGGGLGGWGLRSATSSPAKSPLSSAALLTASHRSVGEIFLYGGSKRWLYMSVDVGNTNGTVICQLVDQNGRVITVGSFRLADGYGSWGSPDPADHGALSGARLLTANGAVLATASFPQGTT